MSLMELLGNVGLFGLAVMVCLAMVSVYSVGLVLAKYRHFRSASRQSQEFRPVFGKSLHAGQFQEVIAAARQHQDSHVARVVSAGLIKYEGATESGSDPATAFELVTSAIEHARVEAMIKMKRGLGNLATIGSTAPFIGLFGTVVGIINAFRGIAATGSGGMAAVSGGIAEALVATALGIFVAIPAVVAFNHFTGKLESFQVEMNQASTELVNYLFHAVPSATAPRRAAHATR
jgi:biopolymer transport protein ExbB/biopolymer transport protein TolQ